MKPLLYIIGLTLLACSSIHAQDARFDVRYIQPHACERKDRVPVALYVYYHPGLNVGGDAPEPEMLFTHWADGLAVSHLLGVHDSAIGLLPPQDSGVLADLLESSPLAQALTDNQTLQVSAVYVVRGCGDTYHKTGIPCAPVRSCGLAVGLAAAISSCDTGGATLKALHRKLDVSAGWCADSVTLNCHECSQSLLKHSIVLSSIPRKRTPPSPRPSVPAAPIQRNFDREQDRFDDRREQSEP